MSTLLAHVAAGTAIYFSYSRLRSLHTWWALPLFVFLAVMPDFDYFAIWIFGVRQSTRITHTLLFCLVMGTAAWLLTRHRHRDGIHSRPLCIAGFLLAPVSHLALDFSVGAHSLPLLWPLPEGELMSPVGVLPGVIHTRNVLHPTMWRNFILETTILMPVLVLLVVRARHADRENREKRRVAAAAALVRRAGLVADAAEVILAGKAGCAYNVHLHDKDIRKRRPVGDDFSTSYA